MKPQVRLTIYWIISLLLCSLNTKGQKRPVKLMVLGSHYLSYEVFEPGKQAELDQLAETLAYFQPTKIVVEVPYGEQTQFRRKYYAYKKGDYYLNSSPAEQIGFRLARRLNHDGVFGIDTSSPYDTQSAIQYARNHGLNHYVDRMQNLSRRIAQIKQQKALGNSVSNYFRYLNHPSTLSDEHYAYVNLFEEMKGDYPEFGSRLYEDWYTHHRHILNQIDMLPFDYGDRVLIIVNSHLVPILRELVEGDITYQWVEMHNYLKIQ